MKRSDAPGPHPSAAIREMLEDLSLSLEEPNAPSRPESGAEGEQPIPAPAPAGPDVIIAEDDEDDYDFLRELLLDQNPELRVTRFTNGADLTDHLIDGRAPAPSLLILDLNMPFKDGREALREIKAVDRFHALRVFVLTTSASPADEAFASEFPRVTFATKPVRYQDYVALVKKLVSGFLPDRHEPRQ